MSTTSSVASTLTSLSTVSSGSKSLSSTSIVTLVITSVLSALLLALIITGIVLQYRRRMAALSHAQADIECSPHLPGHITIEKLPPPYHVAVLSIPPTVYKPGAVHHLAVVGVPPMTYDQRMAEVDKFFGGAPLNNNNKGSS